LNKRIFSLIMLTSALGAAKCQPSSRVPENSAGSGIAEVGGSASESGGSFPGPAPAGSGPSLIDDCDMAEVYATKMGCPLPRPRRASWAEVCRNGRANGVDMQDDCVLIAKSCAEIQKCTAESAP
jgi:hypothetical protein